MKHNLSMARNCVSKVGHLQFALVVGSKTKSGYVFKVSLD